MLKAELAESQRREKEAVADAEKVKLLILQNFVMMPAKAGHVQTLTVAKEKPLCPKMARPQEPRKEIKWDLWFIRK